MVETDNDEFDLVDSSNILVATEDENRLSDVATLATNPDTLISISYGKPIDQWLSGYRAISDVRPETTVGIGVGETVRATTAATGDGGATPQLLADGLMIDSVESADDIVSLGLKLDEYLREFHADDEDEATVTICFDSVSDLSESVGERSAFRFLHILTSHVRQENATAYYLIDADDEKMQTLLRPIFDAYVDTTTSVDPTAWAITADRSC